MISCSLSGGLGDVQVSLGFGEVSLEVGPGFVSRGFAAPVLASIIVQASLEDQVVSIGEDLLVGRGLLSSCCKSIGIFKLFVQYFNGLTWIKWLFELVVIGFQIIWADHAIGGNEVVDDVECGGVGEPRVVILEYVDIHVIDSTDELLFESSISIPVQGKGVVVELVLVG